MSSRSVSLFVGVALVMSSLLACIRPALAAVTHLPIQDSPAAPPRGDSADQTNALCQLGVPPVGPFAPFAIADNRPISIYELASPAGCAVCDPRVLNISSINFLGRFPTLCPITVEVSIVEATGSPGCLTPDTLNVVCPPLSVTITPTVTTVQTYSIPYSCCVSRNVFLRLRIPSLGTCPLTPFFTMLATCTPCLTYYHAGTSFGDFCPDPDFGNPVIWAEADCCDPTPAQRRSWGTLKSLYR